MTTRVRELQIRAELAEAIQRREALQYRWAVAEYTSSGIDVPEDVDVELARVEAVIAELEADLARVLGTTPAIVLPATPANDAHPPEALPEYLTTREAAALLGVSVKHLEALRRRQKGPAFVRVGRAVRYPRSTLLR